MTLFEAARDITQRLERHFRRGADGRRPPVFGGAEKFQTDPLWRDNLLFYENFHGDTGTGRGHVQDPVTRMRQPSSLHHSPSGCVRLPTDAWRAIQRSDGR